MDKKTIVENNPGLLLAALVIPAILAGIFIGYLRGWLIGLVVTAIFSTDSIWTFRSVWLRKEIDSTTLKELESRWITLFNQVIEFVLAAITFGAIYLLFQSPEFLDLLESRNTFSTISIAFVYTALFVVYIFMRWIIINRTTWSSVVLVLILSTITASAIIWTFAIGYTESGIVDTTIEEKYIEEGKSNQVLRFTSDQLNSTDQDIKEKIDQAGKSFLYFSVVTFTTLGYGDFQPTKESRALAAFEALFGMGFMAFLVAVLFQLLLDRARYARSKATVPALWNVFKINAQIVVFSLVLIYIISSLPLDFP